MAGTINMGALDPPTRTDKNGSRYWENSEGLPHREDGPAIEFSYGCKIWYCNGLRHREDGPAVEWADGHKEWYRNGERHREDGPAIEWADGDKQWWVNNQFQFLNKDN